MKHSVAPQSRKAISLAFFCAVCSVMGIRIALSLGRNTSLLIARAKANLLRQGKNPDESWISSIWLPPHFYFLALSFSGNRGRRRRLALGTGAVSSLDLRPKGWFVHSLLMRVVRGVSWDNSIGCVRASCKGDKVLFAFLCLWFWGLASCWGCVHLINLHRDRRRCRGWTRDVYCHWRGWLLR